jgi:low affinity Fe/Cu permease
MRDTAWYSHFAKSAARFCGRPKVFVGAVLVVLLWAISGPLFGFSDTWQLVINTATTVVTFLMVFMIQSSQNRDTEAIQIKLDELIRATKGAHNALLDLEELEDKELDAIRAEYCRIAEEARERLRRGQSDTDVPEVARIREEVHELKHAIEDERRELGRLKR